MRHLAAISLISLASAALAGAGCGGSSPAGPGPSGNPPAGTPGTPTLIMIHSRQAWLRPGDQETVTTNAVFTDGRSGDTPNPMWSSSNTAVFSVAPSGVRAVITAVSPGEARLVVASSGLSNEIPVRVAEVTPPPPGGTSPAGADVVISEFRSAGPGGANDDFVELQNRSGQAVSIAGWSLAFSDGAGNTQTTGNIPAGVTLAPGCHYLFINANPKQSSGEPQVAGDYLFAPLLETSGGIALVDASGRIVDQVATAAGSRYREGQPLPANTFSTGGSFSRTADTNDNAADFITATVASRATRAGCTGGGS